jgi:hypothetical protein
MADVHEELGIFTVDELRAGGIGTGGLVQPLMPTPPGGEAAVAAASESLVNRGMLTFKAGALRPTGAFGRCLRAVAAGRSAMVITAGGEGAHLVFGRLGLTDVVMGLSPHGHAYRARLLGAEDACAEIAAAYGSADAVVDGYNQDGPDEPVRHQRLKLIGGPGGRWLEVEGVEPDGSGGGRRSVAASPEAFAGALKAVLLGVSLPW